MSYVNQFLDMVFRMQGPIPPEVTAAEDRRRRRLNRERAADRRYRSAYCEEVIAILSDPTHNKVTE